MPRRVKVPTGVMGDLELLLVSEREGVWEGEWDALRETPLAALVTRVSREDVEHALRGWVQPLVTALGLPPVGALRKLPMAAHYCHHQPRPCTLYIPADCYTGAKKLSNCFEPAGFDERTRLVAAEAIRAWREGVYVVLVREPGSGDA